MKPMVAILLGAAFGIPAFAQEPVKVVPDAKVEAKKADETKSDDTALEKIKKAKAEYDKAYRAYLTKRQESAALAKEIYEKDPKSDDALAAIELMSQTGGMTTASAQKIYAEVAKNHFANPKIGPMLVTLERTGGGEPFLLKVIDKNPNKAVQGEACFRIAELAASMADREKDPKKATELADKAVKFFEKAKADFGDVVYRDEKLGNLAEGAMFSLKYLKIGKPVPEIEGPDMDEKTFKISDYKGKVVMLDFWGHW